MEIWEITICCENGPTYSILGDEDTFKAELVAWKDYQQRSAAEFQEAQESFGGDYHSTLGFEIRTIEGFSHDMGRFPAVLGYRFNEVQGMIVMRVR